MRCPNCDEEMERDEVDNGVGMQAVGPWGCAACHYVEDRGDTLAERILKPPPRSAHYVDVMKVKENKMNEEEIPAGALTNRIIEGKKSEPMLRHFRFAHLRSERMRVMSMGFAVAALNITENVPGSAERTVALRKLVEAKDCAVRCVIDVEDAQREAEEARAKEPPE